jgi:hypothetical protein
MVCPRQARSNPAWLGTATSFTGFRGAKTAQPLRPSIQSRRFSSASGIPRPRATALASGLKRQVFLLSIQVPKEFDTNLLPVCLRRYHRRQHSGVIDDAARQWHCHALAYSPRHDGQQLQQVHQGQPRGHM